MTTRLQRLPTSLFGPTFTRDFDTLRNNMQRFFDEPLMNRDLLSMMPQAINWMPAVEISEKDKELFITMELPGINPNDVKLTMENEVLTIRGEKKSERKEGEEGTQYYLVERSYGSFQRSFALPWPVNPDAVKAEFDGGILTVQLQKLTEKVAKGKDIPITNKK